MALLFSTVGAMNVNCGSGASIDNMSAGTVMGLVYLNNVNNAFSAFCSKIDAGVTDGWQFHKRGNNGTLMRLYHHRVTTDQYADSVTGTLIAGAWQWIAGTWSIATGLSRVYWSRYRDPFRDVTGSTQTGQGNQRDDSASNLYLAADAIVNPDNLPGAMAQFGIWNRILSLSEMRSQQAAPRVTAGCVGMWWLNSQGAIMDMSGNGNNGTITGATMYPDPPRVLRPTRRFYLSAVPGGVLGSSNALGAI